MSRQAREARDVQDLLAVDHGVRSLGRRSRAQLDRRLHRVRLALVAHGEERAGGEHRGGGEAEPGGLGQERDARAIAETSIDTTSVSTGPDGLTRVALTKNAGEPRRDRQAQART